MANPFLCPEYTHITSITSHHLYMYRSASPFRPSPSLAPSLASFSFPPLHSEIRTYPLKEKEPKEKLRALCHEGHVSPTCTTVGIYSTASSLALPIIHAFPTFCTNSTFFLLFFYFCN